MSISDAQFAYWERNQDKALPVRECLHFYSYAINMFLLYIGSSSIQKPNFFTQSLQMFMCLEALADGGVKMGLPREVAVRLAAQTMIVSTS